ncbi:hypothetical protein SAMN05421505_12755 [Sinosporangium album]|uniref:N-acetyltransferase domain-containing protein n=1 Tax=Sinosporangium album TaxID=504805 RepID=A0A1G8GIA8_9ACTN|nr:GNAT family N-acetyltransferase [Sinosporangium album]SDH94056.1 hypothetical protein SAMN05421505_12755 [Sinosporangium album]
MLTAHLQARRIRLLPADDEDRASAYKRLSGGEPPTDVNAQFTIERRDTGEVVGFGSLGHLDTARGRVQVDVLTDPERTENGLGLEATVLVINAAFAMWDVDRAYFSARGELAESLGSMPTMITPEPHVPEHLQKRATADTAVLAVHREQWLKYGTKFLERLITRPTDDRKGH